MNIPDKHKQESNNYTPNRSDNQNEYRIRTAFGQLILTKNPERSYQVVRILINKKTGHAAHRNYLKRIIKECIRKNSVKFKKFNEIKFFYNFIGTAKFNDINNEISKRASLIPW